MLPSKILFVCSCLKSLLRNDNCYFCVKIGVENKEMLLNPSMPAWFICALGNLDVILRYVTDRDCGRMHHRGLSCCTVMSVSLFIHVPLSFQAAIPITTWWQMSQYPRLSVRDAHTLGRGFYTFAVPLSLVFSAAEETELKTLSGLGVLLPGPYI